MARSVFTNRLQKIEDYLRSPKRHHLSSLMKRIKLARQRCGFAPSVPLTEEEAIRVRGMGLAEKLKFYRTRGGS